MASISAREHVAEIRRSKFSIGGKENPLTEDLHQAVKNLSAELYAKDVHFLMELIQNAEDNEYSEQVEPSLEFVITSKDITATGAPATLLIFNNEKGFSSKNIDSICSVGRSTKKGNRKRGYIGEKGIGFKSVFLITARPYIFSNGYQIRFNEQPCPHSHVGYIVPEWVDQNPNLSDITNIYGSASSLPSTVLVLPLKPDKVDAVKHQVSNIRPQVLLFLSKIKKLSVREVNDDPRLNTVNGIAITKETDFKQSKSIDAESFTLHLSDESGTGQECSYYMWRQKFPVKDKYRVDRRIEVDEWSITLAFRNEGRLPCDGKSPGIYGFLPTEMVTNFPFIIQADFLLASSRETILLDNKWNQGILECIPVAFVSAFKSLVEANREAPASIFPDLFRFLPVNASNYQELNALRESIRSKLVEEEVIPSEVLVKQKFLHKPREVGRLLPSFWSILEKARKEKVSLLSLSSHGKYVLCSSFDRAAYDHVLNFLQVQHVEYEWYVKCIRGSSLAERVSEEVYLELLSFIAENWNSSFYYTSIDSVPLIKYEHLNETLSFFSMSSSVKSNGGSLVYLSRQPHHASWLIEWNREFGSVTNLFFMPRATQEAIQRCPKKEMVLQWLKDLVHVGFVDVYEYASLLCNPLMKDRKLAVSCVHFLYHSMAKKEFLSQNQVDRLCESIPLVDNYGDVTTKRKGVLVPANGSNWAGLVLSNIWKDESYIELSEDYSTPFQVAGKLITPANELVSFLRAHAKADDVPSVAFPNSRIPSVSGALTKENAFLLLQWLQVQKSKRLNIPNRFFESVREGSWLRITLNGCPGSRPPCQSFLLSGFNSWGNLLQNGLVLVDIPMVDLSYYGNDIKNYSEELKSIGVMTEYAEACHFIGKRLMSLAASGSLTRGNVISVLKFIGFLRQCLPVDEFINSIKTGKWMRTSCGDKSPGEAVLFSEKWRTASEISNIPFIDQEYYGEEIRQFEKELELLGVAVTFSEVTDNSTLELIMGNLKPSSSLAGLSSDALLLILRCLRRKSSPEIVRAMKGASCIKTVIGYKQPGDCILCGPGWACLFQVFNGMPLIDLDFYDKSIINFINDLMLIGVTADFEEAAKIFARIFTDRASNRSITKENVIFLLSCYQQLEKGSSKFPTALKKCVRETKWLRTRHCDYYRSPKECVLYSPEWESISQIARIPFIDDTERWYGNGVHEYRRELKSMGVIVDFKEGVNFVDAGLHFHDVKTVTRENVLSLLECIQILRKEKSHKFSEEFCLKLSQSWLKTYVGFKAPSECLLFNLRFAAHLKKEDGPFLDEEFYGPKLGSYKETLAAIGVVVDAEKGGPLLARQLDSNVDFLTIERLYDYLATFNWKPESDSESTIWIPNKTCSSGQWVSCEDCVLSDKSGLFGSQLRILDKYYEKSGILCFFSSAFGVKHGPDTEDYLQLWNSWENSDRNLTHDECCKFWGFISKHWTKNAEKTLPDRIAKVPVKGGSEINLVNKEDVFIADDLLLKELFEESCSRAIFVWYPQPSFPSLRRAKLLEIFQKLGVRTISESVQKEESSTPNGEEVSGDGLIGKGLMRLVLGFLADPAMGMEAKERHKALESLIKLSIVETEEPIDVCYSLSLPCGESLSVRASRTVRWDRASGTIFTHKMDGSEGARCRIERATCFSEVIAEGVLWENGDRVLELSELIKLGFLLGFDEAAIEFLMKSKNLQVYEEDDDFLAAAFPSSPLDAN